jgi:hypothetical protein
MPERRRRPTWRKRPREPMFKAYTPFPRQELEEIEGWAFRNHVRNRGDAVRALVRKGLEGGNAGRDAR